MLKPSSRLPQTFQISGLRVARADQSTQFEIDVRYHGQGLILTIGVDIASFKASGDISALTAVRREFDEEHIQMFTFALPAEPEVVNLRAIAVGPTTEIELPIFPAGDVNPADAEAGKTSIFVDNADQEAMVYDRIRLLAGNRIAGPALVTELDSTTLILPGHVGEVDPFGNIIINPAA